MKIRDYQNAYSGRRCYLLGSGPSIADEDLSLLKNENTFATNWFSLHPNWPELNINFYCAYDARFVTPRPNPQWVESLNQSTSAHFFPKNWADFPEFAGSCFIPYHDEIKIYRDRKFSFDPIRTGFYDGGSVILNFCLPLAMFMGFREIVLLGCEFDYGLSKNKTVDSGYFYPYQKQATPNDHTIESHKIWQQNSLTAFKVIQNAAEKRSIVILNATRGGILDLFPRMRLQEILLREVGTVHEITA